MSEPGWDGGFTGTPVTAFFEHIKGVARDLQKDIKILRDPEGREAAVWESATGAACPLPVLEHIHATTVDAGANIQRMLNSCDPSLADVLSVCGKIFEDNERRLEKAETELERYGYQRVNANRKSLYSFHFDPQAAGDAATSSTPSAGRPPGLSPTPRVPLAPYTSAWRPRMSPPSPASPTLKVSSLTEALFSEHRTGKTPVTKRTHHAPFDGSESSIPSGLPPTQLFLPHGPKPPPPPNLLDSSLLSESSLPSGLPHTLFFPPQLPPPVPYAANPLESSLLSGSGTPNRSTMHPGLEEVSSEEFRGLPQWLQGVLGGDPTGINDYVRAMNDYAVEKWFEGDAAPGRDRDLSTEELRSLKPGLPDKERQGFLLALQTMKRVAVRDNGTRYVLRG